MAGYSVRVEVKRQGARRLLERKTFELQPEDGSVPMAAVERMLVSGQISRMLKRLVAKDGKK